MRDEGTMDSMDSKDEKPLPTENQIDEEQERERVETAMLRVARRRGASMPCGAFARTDWFWVWSKGVDLMDAVCYPQQEAADSDRPDALELARERLSSELDDVCEAVSWNINEYRKTFRITLAELARSIDVSESTLRKKMNDGTLTIREFMTLCAVCLTDPCVVLGLVDSEDASLVRELHYLDKASDHRAVRELVEFLSAKQDERTMIRKSVSPMAEADLGWNSKADEEHNDETGVNWAEIRRELLPTWPLWWETGFDYTEFNRLVEDYLRNTGHGHPEHITYEMKAQAAVTLTDLMGKDAQLRDKYARYRAVRSALGELKRSGDDRHAMPLEKATRDLYADFASALIKTMKQDDDRKVGD